MRSRLVLLMLGAISLAQPPAPVGAHRLMIPACGGGEVKYIPMPRDPAAPDQEDGCAKACHAVADRRSKHRGEKTGGCC